MAEQNIQYRPSGSVYRPAVGPALKKLLVVIGIGLSILGANSVYLAAISFLGAMRDESYENQFYQYMFLMHLLLGALVTIPFVAFGVIHIRNSRNRKNKKAIRGGYIFFGVSLAVIVTGFLMPVRVFPSESSMGRTTYWLHVLLPIAAIAFYISHRLYGPRIKWRIGGIYSAVVLLVVAVMAIMHSQDPREWRKHGGGEKYFQPSEARTANGGFIPAEAMMMDQYCKDCHPDAYADHQHSMHRNSSFNNIPYRFSVRETRKVLMERDGTIQGARWCAGCHDLVPFFSGAFDDPNFDDVKHPTALEGITCTGCHSIIDVRAPIGNGAFVIEEPLHYPFAYSENPLLQWVNRQLVKAKPAFHKKTFLKPLHKTAEFCSVCHKVSLPYELNHYKEWLRGQNHYDSFFLSGVSGQFAGSFYYPPKAFDRCAECHMPKRESDDFGAVDGKISNHRFAGANTGIPAINGDHSQLQFATDFLQTNKVRVDLFAVKEGGTIDATPQPIRPEIPALKRGSRYLLEIYLRTLLVGHEFTQGTVDSNELWLDLTIKDGDRVVARSGALDEKGEVDPWSHFVNALVVDRHGNRIDRRNAQDIFTLVYNHQIPPGAAQVIHYAFTVPEDVKGPLTIDVKLNYRKFDYKYMRYVYGEKDMPVLPIVAMCEDQVTLPLEGGAAAPEHEKTDAPQWMRWNDYGIGLLREGDKGSNKGELRQAEEAFKKVVELGQSIGWVNLARVYMKEGRLEDARSALNSAVEAGSELSWTVNWFAGLIDRQNGFLEGAIEKFERVLATKIPERGFDFSKDYNAAVELGLTYFQRSLQVKGEEQKAYLSKAIERLEGALVYDPENLGAHYNLMLCYRTAGDHEKAEKHRKAHEKYKPDDNARAIAVATYRANNPPANRAAEAVVIYDLDRKVE